MTPSTECASSLSATSIDSGSRSGNRLAEALVLAILLAAFDARAATRRHIVKPPAGVPAAYADLYALLSSQLNAAEAQVAPLHPELKPQPVYASDLLPANGNRGTDLLNPNAMAGVRAFLDRFRQMGLNGVVMTVGYPLLVDTFPNSAQYLDFYKQVIAEARTRGMTVEIESAVIFANSPFSGISFDYSKVPFSQFTQQRHDMVQKIVTELKPDYLELGAEPDTMYHLTGYTQLATPASYATHINQVIAGINRGSTRLGAGIGTWINASWADAESQLPLDFIGLHIYPIDSASIATAFEAAGIARGRGKAVVIDEAWLYKMRPGESTAIADDTVIFQRDAFGFFGPLDRQFLHFLDGFARAEGVALISPFWSTFFFGSLPYTPETAAYTYAETVQKVNAVAAANVVSGSGTPTGTYYSALIAGHR